MLHYDINHKIVQAFVRTKIYSSSFINSLFKQEVDPFNKNQSYDFMFTFKLLRDIHKKLFRNLANGARLSLGKSTTDGSYPPHVIG